MKFPLLGKAGALCAVTALLLLGLNSIDNLNSERQSRQFDAERSLVDSLADEQTVMGPLLRRHCHERWDRTEGDGASRKTVTERRDFVLTAWPKTLQVNATAGIEPRYRGVFKLNAYLTKSEVTAEWADLSRLQPKAEMPNGQLQCDAPQVVMAVSDARGIQSAAIRAGDTTLALLPGSGLQNAAAGFHAALSEVALPVGSPVAQPTGSDAVGSDAVQLTTPLRLTVTLNLGGTRSVAWVPVADATQVRLSSDWPHPSFAGRFLPAERDVTPNGFTAQWQVSALATTAQQMPAARALLCGVRDSYHGAVAATSAQAAGCIDSFGVSFIDPINSYVLSDRALKYALLFIGLTFVGVALVEVMRSLRVHPVQYLLVGSALSIFFLLLLSLAEHVAFGWAYFCASAACCGLLTFYGQYVLHSTRAGGAFGGAIALLYAALYALLQMEQTALVIGSLVLFVALTAVMVATRRIDWYALAEQLRGPRAGATSI